MEGMEGFGGAGAPPQMPSIDPFDDLDTKDFQPEELVDEGDTELVVTNFELKSYANEEKETFGEYYTVALKPQNTGKVNPNTIYDSLFIKQTGDDAAKRNRNLGRIKEFVESAGYPDSKVGPAHAEAIKAFVTGKSVWANVGKKLNKQSGRLQNAVRYYIVPKGMDGVGDTAPGAPIA